MRILDTDVCIGILRGNETVIHRRQETLDEVSTTWISAAELYYGAEKSMAADENREAVGDFLATLHVFGLDSASSRRFGALKAKLERRGEGLADADLLIASISLARGAVLVTGNVRHYDRISELSIEDWIRGTR